MVFLPLFLTQLNEHIFYSLTLFTFASVYNVYNVYNYKTMATKQKKKGEKLIKTFAR